MLGAFDAEGDRVSLSCRPEALEIQLSKTALIVVDMQNAYASSGGYLDLAGFDISGAAAAIRWRRVGWSETSSAPDWGDGAAARDWLPGAPWGGRLAPARSSTSSRRRP